MVGQPGTTQVAQAAGMLVHMYLDRIAAYDKQGPTINAIITINAHTLQEAARLDREFQAAGLVGPLHGIPVILKDQADAIGQRHREGSGFHRLARPLPLALPCGVAGQQCLHHLTRDAEVGRL